MIRFPCDDSSLLIGLFLTVFGVNCHENLCYDSAQLNSEMLMTCWFVAPDRSSRDELTKPNEALNDWQLMEIFGMKRNIEMGCKTN
jgi:hypothetical protein